MATKPIAPNAPQAVFVHQDVLSVQTGLCRMTLKRLRGEGKLQEGIHFVRLSPKILRYNSALVLDWMANAGDDIAHQRAIKAYLSSLPSNQKGALKGALKCAA
jgi:hypothetical protein